MIEQRLANMRGKFSQVVIWQDDADWHEARYAVEQLTGSLGEQEETLAQLAAGIAGHYAELDPRLDRICSGSCTLCQDICCLRATVWYDLTDLLFLQMINKDLPDRQIRRDADGRCSNLGPAGCLLARRERPFICTWYICPAQQVLADEALKKRIEELRTARKAFFEAVVEAVCP